MTGLERMKRRYKLAEMDAFFNQATLAVPDLVGTDLWLISKSQF